MHSRHGLALTVLVGVVAISTLTLYRFVQRHELIRQLAVNGHILGSQQSHAIRVVESADYQCPACALEDSLHGDILANGNAVTMVFHHFPLEGEHPFAFEAAVAAECAASQGSFTSLHHLMFRSQTALGQIPWTQLALQAGVADTAQFSRCMDGTDAANRVVADLRAAAALHLVGTPAFIVGDRVYYGALPEPILRRLRETNK